MSSRKIKVVKRDTPVPERTSEPEVSKNPDRGATNAVKRWISERRENKESETSTTKRQMFVWQQLPEASGELA